MSPIIQSKRNYNANFVNCSVTVVPKYGRAKMMIATDPKTGVKTCDFDVFFNKTIKNAWVAVLLTMQERKQPLLRHTFDLCKSMQNKQMFVFWVVYEAFLEFAPDFPRHCPFPAGNYISHGHRIVDRILPPYLPFDQVELYIDLLERVSNKKSAFVKTYWKIQIEH